MFHIGYPSEQKTKQVQLIEQAWLGSVVRRLLWRVNTGNLQKNHGIFYLKCTMAHSMKPANTGIVKTKLKILHMRVNEVTVLHSTACAGRPKIYVCIYINTYGPKSTGKVS